MGDSTVFMDESTRWDHDINAAVVIDWMNGRVIDQITSMVY